MIKKRKKIELIDKGYIGIITNTDTFTQTSKSGEGYSIFRTGHDSITIRRIAKTKDTLLTGVYDLSVLNHNPDYRVIKWYKENSIQYCHLKKVLEYEYKTVPYSGINTMYYINSLKDGGGCIACFFIPDLNIYYILTTRKYIKKWELTIEK